MSVGRCRGRLLTVMVLVMQTDAPFWDSLVFDGIDDVDVEAVTAAFGTVVGHGRSRGWHLGFRAGRGNASWDRLSAAGRGQFAAARPRLVGHCHHPPVSEP